MWSQFLGKQGSLIREGLLYPTLYLFFLSGDPELLSLSESLSQLLSLELDELDPELELSELSIVGRLRSTLSAMAASSGLRFWKQRGDFIGLNRDRT